MITISVFVCSHEAIKVKSLQCVDRLRGATIEVIEAVAQWRKTMSVEGKAAKAGNNAANQVFMWKGQNYLIKITQDLAFLDREFVRLGLGIHAADNPLLLPESTRHLLPPELLKRCERALAYLRAEGKPNVSRRASPVVAPEKLEDAIDTLAQQAVAQKLSNQLRQRQERPSKLPRARTTRSVALQTVASGAGFSVTRPAQREEGHSVGRRGVVSDEMDAELGSEVLADLEVERRAKIAVVGIQRIARGFLQRREMRLRRRAVSSRHASDEAFAQGIQEASGFFRGLVGAFQSEHKGDAIARNSVEDPVHVMDEPKAATRIQAVPRKLTARIEVAKVREEKNTAALKLQATQRRHNAKASVRECRSQRESVQSKEREDSTRAALRIQSLQRGRAVRNQADKRKPLPSVNKSRNESVVRATHAAEHASTSALEAAAVFSKLAQDFGSPQWSPKPASPPPASKFRTKRRGLLRDYDKY